MSGNSEIANDTSAAAGVIGAPKPAVSTPIITPAQHQQQQGYQNNQQQYGMRSGYGRNGGYGGGYYTNGQQMQQQQGNGGMSPVAPRSLQQQQQGGHHHHNGHHHGHGHHHHGYQFGRGGGMRRVDSLSDATCGTTGVVGVDLTQQVEIYSAVKDVLYILPRSDIVAMPNPVVAAAAAAAAQQQLNGGAEQESESKSGNATPIQQLQQYHNHYGNNGKLQLCPSFDAEKPDTSCPSGNAGACKYVHARVNNAVAQEIHVNYAWRSLDECTCERYSQGTMLAVCMPNQMTGPADDIPSHMVLKTRALHSGRRIISHCAHYYFNRMCNRGANCQFIHAVSLLPAHALPAGEEAAAAAVDFRRLWGRTQQRRAGISAVAAGTSAATPGSTGNTPINEHGPVPHRGVGYSPNNSGNHHAGAYYGGNGIQRNESANSLMYDSPVNNMPAFGGGAETPIRGTPVHMLPTDAQGYNLSSPTSVQTTPHGHFVAATVANFPQVHGGSLSPFSQFAQQQQQQLSMQTQLSPGALSNVSQASTTAGAPVAAPFGSNPSSIASTPMKGAYVAAPRSTFVAGTAPTSVLEQQRQLAAFQQHQQGYYQQQAYGYGEQFDAQQHQQAQQFAAQQQQDSRRGRRTHNPYSTDRTVRYLKPTSPLA